MIYLLFVMICLCVFLKRGKVNIMVRRPPDVLGKIPIIGHALMLIRDDFHTLILKFARECLEKGGVITGYIFLKRIYIITDPEAIMTISNNFLDKEQYFYRFLKPYLNEGLITGNVSTWKRHRKLLNPAFNPSLLKSFVDIFNCKARSLVNRLDLQLGNPLDHERELKLNSLESILLTATGIGDEEHTLQEKYILTIIDLLNIFIHRFLRPWLHPDILYNITKWKRKQDNSVILSMDICNSIIEKKRQKTAATKSEEDKNEGKPKPFLELMLDIKNEMQCFTDEEIIAETSTIISAGFETSASALNLTLIALGSYPDVQENVYNEILQVVGSDCDLNTEHLSQLVYTEAVLKETLRLFPIVPVIARHIDKNTEIKNYTLLANSTCVINIYGLNRHPVWGPDADKFRPERWLDKTRLPDMNNFGSFSMGKRNCIGKTYAMWSMKVTLAHLIRRYRVSGDISNVKFKWRLLSYPVSGHDYILERRELNK